MRFAVCALLFATMGCAASPSSPVVLGVEVDWQERDPQWARAADAIALCASKLEDPRLLNGIRVKVASTPEELQRDCLNAHAAACFVSKKDLAIVSPPNEVSALPGYCHEIGHAIAEMQTPDDLDYCHKRAALWAAIDGSTCTCRCEPAAP